MNKSIKEFKQKLNNNKGLSIAELIISFSLLAVVALGVMMILSAGTNMFTRIDSEINLQYKSQTAMAQFQQFFMNCSAGITKMDSNGVIYLCDDKKVYALRFDPEANEIYYGEQEKPDESGVDSVVLNPADILCSDVESFKANVVPASKGGGAGYVRLELILSNGRHSFTASQVYSFRNRPHIYADYDSFINGVASYHG